MWYAIVVLAAAIWVGMDAYSRRANVVLMTVGALLASPIVVPIWLASRPLRLGETREGGRAWNVLRNFALMWTLLMAIATCSAIVSMGQAITHTEGAAAQAGAGLGILLGVGFLGALWFFPMVGALVLGLILKKATDNEVGPTGPPANPNAAPRRFAWTTSTTAALAFLAILIAIGTSSMKDEGTSAVPYSTPSRATATEPNVPATVAQPEPDPPGSFRDGSHVVGTDIQPGTYRTWPGSRGCFWSRLSGFSGEIGDIIANGAENGPAVVTIGASDKGFDSKRCGLWVPGLPAITESPTESFGDGTYVVATDIASGTWRSDSPSECYWSRLRGFGGGIHDIIANGVHKNIVTISATDKGFQSKRCGSWTRMN
jgi:hypothetical protein